MLIFFELKTIFYNYGQMLEKVFKRSSMFFEEDASVYVRTDNREFTKNTTIEVLKTIFPTEHMLVELFYGNF